MRNTRCGNCGNKLDGKQVQWCSAACANAAWQREHADERAAYMRARRADRPAPTIKGRLLQRIAQLEAELRDCKENHTS